MTRTSVADARVALRRTRAGWRLLATTAAVAVVSSSLIGALSMLVTATETGGVRDALTSLEPDRADIEITVFNLTASIAESRAAAAAAVTELLGEEVPISLNGQAVSRFSSVPAFDAEVDTLTYFGEYDDAIESSRLVRGEWASGPAADGQLDVAVPEAAAAAFGLDVGDEFELGDEAVSVRVVGVYAPLDEEAPVWSRDPLGGLGYDPAFPKPDTGFSVPVHAFGPLLAAPGAIDEAGVAVDILVTRSSPDFSGVTVESLESLSTRLSSAEDDVYASMGDVAGLVFYDSALPPAVARVISQLALTRSSVAVAGVLLAVLAAVALFQTARLIDESRDDERRLMRARGASRMQLLRLDLVEAALIAGVTALAAPAAASGIYSLLAATPAMLAAGMPATVGLPASAWLISAAIAGAFAAVLIVPRLLRDRGDGEGGRRRDTTPALLRSGLDLAFVALAVVALWQLQQYRDAQPPSGLRGVDPVLVAAPAVVLVAGALLCMRLIPLVGPLLNAGSARDKGAVWPLAAWEIGRRSSRVAAAALLLTLSLATANFSLSFLATWTQSLSDQAAVAVGAPVVAEAADEPLAEQRADLSDGADSAAAPTLRRSASVLGPGAYVETGGGTPATVLGLSAEGRAMLDRGRVGEEGGTVINSTLVDAPAIDLGVPLDGSPRLAVTVASRGSELVGVDAGVRAVVDNGGGALSNVDLGRVPLDGLPHEVSAIPETDAGPAALVGLQFDLAVVDPDAYGGLGGGAFDGVVTVAGVDFPDGWSATGTGLRSAPPTTESGSVTIEFAAPSDLTTSAFFFTATAWQPTDRAPIVVSTSLAESLNMKAGSPVTLIVAGTAVGAVIEATTPLIPGTANADLIGPVEYGTTSGAEAIAIDGATLARALAQSGFGGPLVDEWWIDVPADEQAAYIDTHRVGPDDDETAPIGAATLALDLQRDPLRVGGQISLLLTALGSIAVALIGFAVHTAATLASRRLEFAQLRAIGLSRRGLLTVGAIESLLLVGFGALAGTGLGALLGWAVAPLITVSPTGAPPLPVVDVVIPVLEIVPLTALVAAALVGVRLALSWSARSADPASILRGAAE